MGGVNIKVIGKWRRYQQYDSYTTPGAFRRKTENNGVAKKLKFPARGREIVYNIVL